MAEDALDITICPGGPFLIRGLRRLKDADGIEHVNTRPVAAVCRCGKTGRGPWCDGTHKLL